MKCMLVECLLTGNNVCTHVNSCQNRNGSEMVNAYGRKFFESPVWVRVIRVSGLNEEMAPRKFKANATRGAVMTW